MTRTFFLNPKGKNSCKIRSVINSLDTYKTPWKQDGLTANFAF